MSKLPVEQASARPLSTASLTVEELHARYDRRALAWYCRNQSIRVRCIHRISVSPFDQESEASLLATLPPTPDEAMARTINRWDTEQQRLIAYQQSRWSFLRVGNIVADGSNNGSSPTDKAVGRKPRNTSAATTAAPTAAVKQRTASAASLYSCLGCWRISP